MQAMRELIMKAMEIVIGKKAMGVRQIVSKAGVGISKGENKGYKGFIE